MTARELIDWFWREFAKHARGDFEQGSLCQCGTEHLIELCDNPYRMRAFLLVAVAIDQAIRPVLGSDYATFREAFRFPRLQAHGGGGEAGAGWLIYEYHRFHTKMNWRLGAAVGNTLVSSVRSWFSSNPERTVVWLPLAARLEWLPECFAKYDLEAADCLAQSMRGEGDAERSV